MRIATWNVNNVRKRLPQLLAWLDSTRPDIVALQELKTETAAFPRAELEAAGYGCLVAGQRTWNGVALLSRGHEAIEIHRVLPGDLADKQARFLEAAINGVAVACLYLPNGNPRPGPKFDYKLAWFERLIDHAASLMASGKPVVLAGDFNVVPTDQLDIYSPEHWKDDALLQAEPRESFERLLAQGWTDTLRARYPDARVYTYWDYLRNRWPRNAGLRIDHILLSPSLRLVEAGVDREMRGNVEPSDHAPVWAEVELAKAARARTRTRQNAGLARAVDAPLPDKLAPQLATLATAAHAGMRWVVENKFDGYRLLARVDGKKVKLFTRHGYDWTTKFKGLAADIATLDMGSGWLDGEIVVMNAKGVPDFSALQHSIDNAKTKDVVYFVFDLPFHGGKDLRQVPLIDRRAQLQRVLAACSAETLRFSESFDVAPAQMLAAACQMGMEGVMAKRADSAYVSSRTDTWLKFKCSLRQEFIVIGFTDRAGAKGEVGGLLLAYHDEDGKCRSAGSVGTGWNSKTAQLLHASLSKLETRVPSVDLAKDAPGRWSTRLAGGERWVKPTVVVEVSFAEWTPDGKIRHAVYKGVRTDKPPKAITRERASGPAATAAPAARKSSVKVTNPERVIDPTTGLTKVDLVRYYESIAEYILPHLKGRPVSLVRAPDGVAGKQFFQKHDESKLPGLTQLDVSLWPGHAPLLCVDNVQALLSAAQMNVVEFHTWNSVARSIDKPNRVVFDLDPGEGVTWKMVQDAALLMRALLEQIGLEAWLKTSGGKGLHVVVPLSPRLDDETIKTFSQAAVRHMATTFPSRFVAVAGGGNRVGKIFIDYLRNGHGQTTAAAFSARARSGLGVSMPVSWGQLPALKSGAEWTITTTREHLSRQKDDPWKNYWTCKQVLTAAMRRLEPVQQADRDNCPN